QVVGVAVVRLPLGALQRRRAGLADLRLRRSPSIGRVAAGGLHLDAAAGVGTPAGLDRHLALPLSLGAVGQPLGGGGAEVGIAVLVGVEEGAILHQPPQLHAVDRPDEAAQVA